MHSLTHADERRRHAAILGNHFYRETSALPRKQSALYLISNTIDGYVSPRAYYLVCRNKRDEISLSLLAQESTFLATYFLESGQPLVESTADVTRGGGRRIF